MSALSKLIQLAQEKRGKVVDENQQPAYCMWDLAWVVKDNNDWCAKLIWVEDADHLFQLREQSRIFHFYVALDVPRSDFENDGRVRETLKELRNVTNFEDELEEVESPPKRRIARQYTPQRESNDSNAGGCGEVVVSWIIAVAVIITAVGWLINQVVQILLWIVRTPIALTTVVSLIVGLGVGVIANGKSRIGFVIAGVVLGAVVGTGLGSAAFAFSGADSVSLYILRVINAFFWSGVFAALAMRYGQEAPQIQRWWWTMVSVLSMTVLIASLFATMNERTNQLLLVSRPQESSPPEIAVINSVSQPSPSITTKSSGTQHLKIIRPDRDPKTLGYKRLYDLAASTCDEVSAPGETKSCNITVQANKAYAWGSAWCATKTNASARLQAATSIEYIVDNTNVPASSFWHGTSSTCSRYRAIITGFKSGSQHELQLVITLNQNVSDGSSILKAGRYELLLNVEVR